MKTDKQNETEVILAMGRRIKELETEVEELKGRIFTLTTDKEYDI